MKPDDIENRIAELDYKADLMYCDVCKCETKHQWLNYILVRYYICTVCREKSRNDFIELLSKLNKSEA